MEGCGADDAIECICKWKMQEVSSDQLAALTELRAQVFTGGPRHVLRNVEPDHASVGEGLKQIGSQASGTAASIKDKFVASQPQAGENLLSPTDLRLGEAMVFGGIPFASG